MVESNIDVNVENEVYIENRLGLVEFWIYVFMIYVLFYYVCLLSFFGKLIL